MPALSSPDRAPGHRDRSVMSFKDTPPRFQTIDLALIDPPPQHPRQQLDESGLKALANSIRKIGLIHPVVVQPADAAGRHTLIAGQRRWRAAQLAGEKTLPALVRACDAASCLEVQVFENLGLGLRVALEPREMANAIATLAESFENREAAAEHFGRTPAWLNQATAAAKLSPKVSALLDSGKIASTGAAVQLEKLAQKDESKAETLIVQIENLPQGEKLAKRVVDHALSAASGRQKRQESETAAKLPPAGLESAPPVATDGSYLPPWEAAPAAPAAAAPAGRRINPGKVRQVAKILGLADGDEEDVLIRLIDEFLAMNENGQPRSP